MTSSTCLPAAPATLAPRGPIRLRLLDRLALIGQRRALRRLDDRQLTDLGLSPEEARREAARPFWDAPARWHD